MSKSFNFLPLNQMNQLTSPHPHTSEPFSTTSFNSDHFLGDDSSRYTLGSEREGSQNSFRGTVGPQTPHKKPYMVVRPDKSFSLSYLPDSTPHSYSRIEQDILRNAELQYSTMRQTSYQKKANSRDDLAHGVLYKQGRFTHRFFQRTYWIKQNSLYYLPSGESEAVLAINFNGSTVIIDLNQKGKYFGFTIQTTVGFETESISLYASSNDERDIWIAAITAVVSSLPK
eukprot:c12004_g1_i1.p1 GENE.c12004_g1_i1~~c12004_g1_i1.p1  ORF type:complete len:228 (-),score=73.68 c12004_g1_i1:33-716(-)